MDNPEKLATQVTQDEEQQHKNTTQYVLDITIRKETQITQIRHESSYKQLEVKTNRTSFFMRTPLLFLKQYR
jgi:hypothetical protein